MLFDSVQTSEISKLQPLRTGRTFRKEISLAPDLEDTSYIFCRVVSRMMLDKMVPNVVLCFTILVILNSIGITSSHDELEHGLATDCDSKSMKT